MAFTVDPLTNIITVPKTDLTLVSGTLYEYDTDTFRLELKDFEASPTGIVYLKTHNHNTEVVIVGITYARTIDVIAPWSIEFEDGQYTVILIGSNNNIWDVASGILEQNQVQVIPTNSAGLIVKETLSAITEQDKEDIAALVPEELIADHRTIGSLGEAIRMILYRAK